MSLRAVAVSVVLGMSVPGVAWTLPLAQATPPRGTVVSAAAPADPVDAHAAIAQAQERLSEIDATITVLQDDADKADAALRQRAHDEVAALRTIRETYRKEIDGVMVNGRQMTAEQIAVARVALEAPWTQFEGALDRDVAAIKLDAGQRKALVEARIKAEQAYWQKVIGDLQASATNLTAEQRAAIDARIARVKAHVDEAQTRLTRLATATHSAWSVLKKGLIGSRQVFDETYRSAR